MPLMPKRVKYRKSQRGSRKGTASRNLKIDFGEFGLQTLERAWITNTQLEAARVALTRNMKRKGKLWIRIFPDKSVTARPPETRMGKGKGQPEYWVATVRPGNILFELDGVRPNSENVERRVFESPLDRLWQRHFGGLRWFRQDCVDGNPKLAKGRILQARSDPAISVLERQRE